MVRIKVINHDKPLVGAVQKVLNHIINLKSASDQQIMLTFADIESVTSSQLTTFWNFYRNVSKNITQFLEKSVRKTNKQTSEKTEILLEGKSSPN